MLQHHVHLKTEADPNGPKKPLPSCLTKASKGECRGRFPREKEMCEQSHVVCRGIAKTMGLRTSGKKNMLGSVVGPRNNPWLNGTHPALLYDMRCNSDTLLTYKLPIVPETHSVKCEHNEDCLSKKHMHEVIIAALRSQRDQAGYVSDYVAKPQPIARNEIKAQTLRA